MGELSTKAVDRLRKTNTVPGGLSSSSMAIMGGGGLGGLGSPAAIGGHRKRESWGMTAAEKAAVQTLEIRRPDDLPHSNKAWKVLGRSPPPPGAVGSGGGSLAIGRGRSKKASSLSSKNLGTRSSSVPLGPQVERQSFT